MVYRNFCLANKDIDVLKSRLGAQIEFHYRLFPEVDQTYWAIMKEAVKTPVLEKSTPDITLIAQMLTAWTSIALTCKASAHPFFNADIKQQPPHQLLCLG